MDGAALFSNCSERLVREEEEEEEECAPATISHNTLPDWCRFARYEGPPAVDPKITVARTLKALNPKIKLLWYQAADWVSQSPYVKGQILANPQWWLKDDFNNTVLFAGVPELDWSVPEAREWLARVGAGALQWSTPIDRQVHSPSICRFALSR